MTNNCVDAHTNEIGYVEKCESGEGSDIYGENSRKSTEDVEQGRNKNRSRQYKGLNAVMNVIRLLPRIRNGRRI